MYPQEWYGSPGEIPLPQNYNYIDSIRDCILHEYSDSIFHQYKDSSFITSVLVRHPGIVDSALIINPTNNSIIDSCIISSMMEMSFTYPDTNYGYANKQWINIPIKIEPKIGRFWIK